MEDMRLKKLISDDLYMRRYEGSIVMRLSRDLIVINKEIIRNKEVTHLRVYCGQHKVFCFQSKQPKKWNAWKPEEYDIQSLCNEVTDKDLFEGTCMDSLLPYVKSPKYPHGNKINLGNLITAKCFLCYEQALRIDQNLAEGIMRNIQKGIVTESTRPLSDLVGVSSGQVKFLKGLQFPDDLVEFKENVLAEDFQLHFPDVKKRLFAVSFYLCFRGRTMKAEVFDAAQTLNSIEKSEERNRIAGEYADYLYMRRMNLHPERFPLNLKPSRIREMHDELARECNNRIYRKDNSKCSPAIEKQKKEGAEFEYSDGTYMITLPKNAEDIVREGNCLKHCVGIGGYIQRMADGNTRILFLRTVKEPDKPLITIEEQQGSIRQCFGYHDTYNTDIRIRDFIIEYAKKRGLTIDTTIYKATLESV